MVREEQERVEYIVIEFLIFLYRRKALELWLLYPPRWMSWIENGEGGDANIKIQDN